jgi:hypothetical protein
MRKFYQQTADRYQALAEQAKARGNLECQLNFTFEAGLYRIKAATTPPEWVQEMAMGMPLFVIGGLLLLTWKLYG